MDLKTGKKDIVAVLPEGAKAIQVLNGAVIYQIQEDKPAGLPKGPATKKK
jgi:hypothetical protein